MSIVGNKGQEQMSVKPAKQPDFCQKCGQPKEKIRKFYKIPHEKWDRINVCILCKEKFDLKKT